MYSLKLGRFYKDTTRLQDTDVLRLLNENEELKVELKNKEAILDDFISVVNEYQYYFQSGDDYRTNKLDHIDYYDLYKLSCRARDMLTMMDKKVKE